MGSLFKLESNPEIRGSTPEVPPEQSNYFFRIHTLLRKSYIDNKYNDNNLNNSLELKSFKSNPTHPPVVDMTWLEYIENYLEDILDKKHYSWCSDLLFFFKRTDFYIRI